MGESPLLCVSGFHHPALSRNTYSAKGDPIVAFSYQADFNTEKPKMQAIFRIFLRENLK
jgi:hypothetical protein